ncbi:MAG: glycoside hydrolase family 88 protein [Clostridia bacterium]|nr:glycoside hydrolase family 88 protein [Clostridia bacterium]
MHQMIEQYILELIRRSTPRRTAWNMEKVREGKDVSWNYIDGCMLTALTAMTDITGDDRYAAFVEEVADSFVREDGSIDTFQPEKHALDDYNEGRILFPIYARTEKEKYRKAAEMLYESLKEQPRTEEGNFWHKEIYPNQVWLDGTYMALPFLAMYEDTFGTGEIRDIMKQLRVVRRRMRDPKTGLYYHGYDASRKAFWADPETGLSRNFWLRAIGWFSLALADLIEIIPKGMEERDELAEMLQDLAESISAFADPESGMYWQVVDCAGREGNYLETSGSAMIACAMLKGVRLGALDAKFREMGRKTFNGIVQHHLKVRDGMVGLDNICLVAGLGPENNRRRDGSYEYYVSEPVVSDDAKGAAPFVLCYTEIRRADGAGEQ